MSGLKNIEQLEDILERDPDNLEQIQYWYEQFSEYEIDGNEPINHLLLVFRGLRWIMQYEHTASDELKELAERQAVEIAEKEENWEQERDLLKEEISSLRERITSKAGMDEMNEAFRAEIDSLNSESAHLKQMGRERDRELADQRDKVEELTGKLGIFERERNAWTNTQIQLEDTIRELNRRLSAKTDLAPRNEWESRKLKQRSEQALMLGNQLRNADAQNVELKERVENLTKALEEATSLLQETTKKYERLREQFNQTTSTAEKLFASNQDLKRMLDVKDEILGDKEQTAESSTKQLGELLRTKDAQIQRLRETNQKYEMEIEELQARIHSEHSMEREEELERLRLELVEATKVARQLFGETLMVGADEDSQAADLTGKLRLRIVQVNEELNKCRQKLELNDEERSQLSKLIEQKDARLAQLYTEVDRVRKLAFGDADLHIRELEKQIKFREQQISKLTLKCSLMQIDLENASETKETPKKKTQTSESKRKEHKKPEKTPKKEVVKEEELEEPIESSPTSVSLDDEEIETQQIETESPKEEKPKRREPSQRRKKRKQFTVLELIKLFDDNEIGDHSAADLTLLSSLFIELKRLNQELEERDKQVQQMNGLVNDGHLKIVEQSAKFKKLQDDYDKFRLEIFGTSEVETDADTLRRRIEELQIENIEFRRFVDSVKNGGSELERRFEEATRRLIHLGIQVNQHERKSTNLTRRHKALGEECERLRVQLMRFQSGEKSKKSLEINMIEIARLQNALVHSVPQQSYNNLLVNFKKLLHTQTLDQLKGVELDLDPGYQSDIEKQQFDISLNDFMRQNRTNEQILIETSQLKETVDILTKQIDYWKRQHSKQADEIQELNAFLDDLENSQGNQTDLKSMIVNIERRFLQALHEQSDSTEEQLSTEKELKHLKHEIHTSKRHWRQDRQKLVEIIMGLQLSIQRLRANTANSLNVQQLLALRTATEELKLKEQTVEKQLNDAELKLVDLERKEALAEATRESVEQLLSSNFQLQDMQLAFQRSAFHIKTLANELKTNQKKLDSVSNEFKKQMEENSSLRKELDELVIASTDPLKLKALERDDSIEQTEMPGKSQQQPHRQTTPQTRSHLHIADSEELSSESERITPRPKSISETQQPKQAVIFDNSEEYEREISAIKKAARISIQNYKEQLERKEQAIEEYRSLLTELSASANAQRSHQQNGRSTNKDLPLKRAAEILSNGDSEERDKQLIILRWELAELEEANAQLAEKLRLANEVSAGTGLSTAHKQTVSVQTDFNLAEQSDDNFLNEDEEQFKEHKSTSGESSDSGTAVNDMEEDEEEEIKNVAAKGRQRSNSTRTIESGTRFNATDSQRPPSALSEAQVFQHRNEIRRLRTRIATLEMKNRELTAEHESLKQRTRHFPQRNPDPNAEVNILRKENDRMRRENKNLQQTLTTQSDQIEDLEKKLKRRTEHMRDTIESWEEKKSLEKELRSVKQKLQIADNKLLEVNDKLERRDRLIENLNRSQNERVFSVDKFKNEVASSRKRVEELQRTEASLRNENLVLQERIRDANSRIEIALKENHQLRNKLPKNKSNSSIQVQTPAEWTSSGMTKVWEINYTQRPEPKRPNFGMHSSSNQRVKLIDIATNTTEMFASSTNEDTKKLLKKARLEYEELMSQYDELNINYERLEDEYRRFKNVRRKETFESAAVTLLEDKLRAKQRELERQRQTIDELEQRLQRILINR